MAIRITNQVVLTATNALQMLATKDFSAPIAYKILRLHRALAPEFKQLNAFHQQLVQKYGQLLPTPEGVLVQSAESQYHIAPEDMPAFTQERDALMAETIEITGDPLTLVELGTVSLSAAALDALGALLVEG